MAWIWMPIARDRPARVDEHDAAVEIRADALARSGGRCRVWQLAVLGSFRRTCSSLVCLRDGVWALYFCSRTETSKPSRRMSMWMLGVLYAGVLIVPLVMFKTRPSSAVVLSMSVCRAWGSDTGAYFAGRFCPYIPGWAVAGGEPEKPDRICRWSFRQLPR